MQLWNTLTGRKEPFTGGKMVRIYVCGITPYATTHLGHARTYVLFDVLIRELERRGHSVRYTQNVTDVDDPLFDRAQELGIPSDQLATECTRTFQDDMAALSVRPPDYYPRASDEILEMQALIASLLEQGHAYLSGGRVYYRVRSFRGYGKLSKLKRDEMLVSASETGEDPDDPNKEDSLDFVLWKPSQPGEDSWPSPWGRGRPGWHIECSAMALQYLSRQIDIHGGGTDLVYPHHENEIAQSEAATGEAPFARFWVHVEMMRLGGTKMSKSLGNLVWVRDVLPVFGPAVVRHYLLSTHYRTPMDYATEDLRRSAERVERVRRALLTPDRAVEDTAIAALQNRFDVALARDLDTAEALEALDSLARLILSAPVNGSLVQGIAALRGMAERLGLAVELPGPAAEAGPG